MADKVYLAEKLTAALFDADEALTRLVQSGAESAYIGPIRTLIASAMNHSRALEEELDE